MLISSQSCRTRAGPAPPLGLSADAAPPGEVEAHGDERRPVERDAAFNMIKER
jgi:hypothetical protein